MTSTREKLALAVGLICAVVAAVIPLLTAPQFRSVFEAFHAELPLLTRFFIYYTQGLWLLSAAVIGAWLCWPQPTQRATAVVLIGVGGLGLLTPLYIYAMYLPIYNLGQ
ncbi:MAG: hypothetical protein ABWY06_16855 [Pseudomonas sp.]|uniref:hypothetical protein n=1 Tax=Pseudomonas sp. TaxID=306 RepID=UPI0033911A5A